MGRRQLRRPRVHEKKAPAAHPATAAPAQQQRPPAPAREAETLACREFSVNQRDAGNELQAHRILSSGGFSVEDLRQMVRGQILHGGPIYACGGNDDGQSTLPVWPRRVDQPALAGPFDPARTPPNTLRCPLEQRGDATVPCSCVQRQLEEEEDEGDEEDEVPCQVFLGLAYDFLDDTFGGPRPDEVRAPPGGNTVEAALAQMHYLVDSERLDLVDLHGMLENGLYVPVPGWLPCQDDSQRDRFDCFDGPPDPDFPGDTEWVPAVRVRCPLQVQAVLGHRGVACAEAQALRPSESLVRAARQVFPDGLDERHERDLDPAAGTDEDPVRRLGLRPCQLLGQVLDHGLQEVLRRLASDEGWLEKARRLVEGTGPDDLAGEGSWTPAP